MMAQQLNDENYMLVAERHAQQPVSDKSGRQTTMGELAIARGLFAIARAITAHTEATVRIMHQNRKTL